MAATPYPTDYVYAGNAVALTLKTAVSDGGGDLTLTVNEETSTKGWPSLGAGQRFVIVVGRGTAYETKYAVKTITSSVSGSTLVVDSADKTFDNTPVTAAPAGTVVEHCWSATEASLANDHMRTKQAHGSDGDLVDQNTAQLLSNKTVMTPTASGHPTTKSYVDAADAVVAAVAAAALPKAGGTMTGDIAMSGGKTITGLPAADANGEAVRWEQIQPVYAIGVLTSDQTIAASGTNVTVAFADGSDPYGINSSGVFTLPSAGVWLVSGVAEFDTGFSFNNTIALVHNSTRIAASKPWYTKVSPAQGTPWAAWSILINAAASDTVKMVADNSNGLSGIPLLATVTRMSVVKIGA